MRTTFFVLFQVLNTSYALFIWVSKAFKLVRTQSHLRLKVFSRLLYASVASMLFSEGISNEADSLVENLVTVGIQVLSALISPFFVLGEDQFTEGEVGVSGWGFSQGFWELLPIQRFPHKWLLILRGCWVVRNHKMSCMPHGPTKNTFWTMQVSFK